MAFDVGTRNMGIAVLDDGRLEKWETWDLTGGKPARKVPVTRMIDTIHGRVHALMPIHTVLIEQQMSQPHMGISWALYAYFLGLGVTVRLVHASVKLKRWSPARFGGKYEDRKRWAVDAVYEELKKQDPKWTIVFAAARKKDDMADALLYALTV